LGITFFVTHDRLFHLKDYTSLYVGFSGVNRALLGIGN